MFRKPMRLEKWVAFDGALAVDIAAETQDVAVEGDEGNGIFGADRYSDDEGVANDAPDSDDDVFVAQPFGFPATLEGEFSFPNNTIWLDIDSEVSGHEASLSFPRGFNVSGADPFLPYHNADISLAFSAYYPEPLYVNRFFFEIGKPDNGTFSFLLFDDQFTTPASFIADNGLNPGQWYMLDYVLGGNRQYRLAKVSDNGQYFSDSEPALLASYTGNGALRVGFLINQRGALTGPDLATIMLKSLAFTAKDAEQTTGGSFSLKVFYKEYNGDLYSNPSVFGSGPNGVFNPDNTPTAIVNDTTQYYYPGNANDGIANPPGPPDPVPDPDPDPDPDFPDDPDDPDPETPVDPTPDPSDPDPDPDSPVPDPTPPVDTNVPDIPDGGDAGRSDAGSDNGGGEALGDSGGDAVSGQDGFLHVHIEEPNDDVWDVRDTDAKREATDAAEDVVVRIEDKRIESAGEALMLEIMRELDSLIHVVRGDKNQLLRAIDYLRLEYSLRDASDWAELRETLRRLFETGNRELEAVNRVIDQMQNQASVYHSLDAARRDGMLLESLRELMDSTVRRSGETGALSGALNAVADLLRESRRSGAVPDSGEVDALFQRAYDAAIAQWEAQLARTDAMGRELAETLQATETK